MNKYLIGAIIFLLGLLFVGWKKLSKANEKWQIAEANVKAYSNELSTAKSKNTALQLSIAQLNYFNDSILQSLNSIRKELKIKDKNLKALQAIQSSFAKVDTINIVQVDTLFKDQFLNVDTLLGDEWYTLQLGLKYPSAIVIRPQFKSEKYVIVSSKKETVNPPKKFFLFRWFQKKHTVLHIDVVEKNPYVEGESSKYVEIIK